MTPLYSLLMMAAAGGLGLYSLTCSAAEAPAAMPPLESFSEVIQRPLFAPDRRRHLKPAAAAPAGKPVLSAIIMLKSKRYAMLRDGEAPARQVHEGDSIGGMTVKKILRDRVVLAGADGNETALPLFPNQPGGSARSASSEPPPVPAFTAGMSGGPPAGMIPGDNRPRKPLITPDS